MVPAYLPAPPPAIAARAAVVIDGDTGQVLYARDPHEELPNASTTKLMTAIVATRFGNLDQVVTVSTDSARVGGSSLYLEAGERMTLEQLLYGMLMISGNDAADAIARTVGGSVPHFVSMMNAEAAELHLANTHFANPHGLPDPDHFTSAYDLSIIARTALSTPEIARITDTRTLVMAGNDRIRRRFLVNHNRLLGHFPGALGGKTGYTVRAGKCFVGSARRDGRYVIETILNDRMLWRDAARLLDYGLDDFKTVQVAPMGTVEGSVPVSGGRSGSVAAVVEQPAQASLPMGALQTSLATRVVLDPSVQAPVSSNQALGQLQVLEGNDVVATVPLVAQGDVPKAVPLSRRLLGALGWFLSGGAVSVGLFTTMRLRQVRTRRTNQPLARVAQGRSAS